MTDTNVDVGLHESLNAHSFVVPANAPRAKVDQDPAFIEMQRQLARMSAVSELVSLADAADDTRDACQMMADQIKRFLAVDQVLIGLCQPQGIRCTLVAVSEVASFHPHGQLAVSAEAVLQECLARGQAVCWPESGSQGSETNLSEVNTSEMHSSGGLLAHQQFALAANIVGIASMPLRDANGRVCGAWMTTGKCGWVHSNEAIGFLEAASTPVSSSLSLLQRAQRGRVQKLIDSASRWASEKRGRAVIFAALVMMIILCIPTHYRAKCDCTVEPVTRRYVAAPFAGPLQKTFVQPGDLVETGQLLARIDARELRMELSSTRAELHRAAKQHAGHLAILDSGESEVARFEVDQLKVRTQLLEHRERNVEIRSPIDGMVISGDLEDAQGMPLELGQMLFEISPLDSMIVEVNVAEDDFFYIRPGMPVSIRLDAFPLRRFEASVKRVHPRAELRQSANVFVAEVVLTDTPIGFRPGMQGTAKIKADRYPIAWNWFRRPLAALLTWLGW